VQCSFSLVVVVVFVVVVQRLVYWWFQASKCFARARERERGREVARRESREAFIQNREGTWGEKHTRYVLYTADDSSEQEKQPA
jgi:hypothetical protein